LIILPRPVPQALPISFGHTLSDQLGLTHFLEAYLALNENPGDPLSKSFESVGRARAIWDRIRLVAQLGALDGALVLDGLLDVRGFGAKLDVPPWNGEVITGPNGWGDGAGQPFDSKRFGTRHNSAIAFVDSCAGATAFVMSEDGGVRAFRRLGDDVRCWLDFAADVDG
jgi:hypothetical protein